MNLPSAVNKALGYSYLVGSESLTWEEARQACSQRGYHLAWIESETEDQYIHNMVTAHVSCRSGTLCLYIDYAFDYEVKQLLRN